ncbi:MAG: M48 family metallopeptidase [Candidatus Berkiella sp.]
MNFFEHQDKARRKSKILILYFVLALLIMIFAMNAAVYGILYYTSQQVPDLRSLMNEPLWLYISLTLTIIIVSGSLFKMYALRGGGTSVANMVNARRILTDTSDFHEKRLIHIVEEMSIASGVPMPALYIMDKEMGINAFVAGITPKDTVLVVTKGSLENLNREELQAVIGHEFSHIFNGDMKINIRLMAILAGILLIGNVGSIVLRGAGHSSGSKRRDGKGGGGVIIILLIALVMIIFGYLGLFLGRIIKAAVSRQRELLADACSVQYTRYPQGLASAFKRMLILEQGSKLKSSQAEEINHLCFGEAMSFTFFNSLFATHPPLDQRIKAIDPYGKYTLLNNTAQEEKLSGDVTGAKKTNLESVLAPIMYTMAATASTANTHAETMKNSIGNPSDAHFEHAKNIHNLLPEALLDRARNKEKVEYLYYGLILRRYKNKTSIIEHLSKTLNKAELESIYEIYEMLKSLPLETLVPLFDISLPAFSENPLEKRNAIYNRIEALSQTLKPSLFRFALLTLLGKQLTESTRASDRPKYYSLDSVREEIATLFAFVTNYSYSDEAQRNEHFANIVNALLSEPIEKPNIKVFKAIQFRNVLEKLNKLTPELKEKIISSCVELVLSDNHVKIQEAEIIRVISGCLDSPMPPFINEQITKKINSDENKEQ